MKYFKKINLDIYFACEVHSILGNNAGVIVEIEEDGSMFYNRVLSNEELNRNYKEISAQTFQIKLRLAFNKLKARLIKSNTDEK